MHQSNINEPQRKIVEATRSLFLSEGYNQVSMRKIASKVGYSPTNIYNYFKNKEEIVLHLLKEGYAIFLDYLEQSIKTHEEANVLVQLKAILFAYVQFSMDYADYYNLIFIHNLESEDTVVVSESDRIKGFQLLLEITKEAVEKKAIVNQDPVLVSESLWALVHGLSSLFIKFPTFQWADKRQLIKHHIETHIDGLAR